MDYLIFPKKNTSFEKLQETIDKNVGGRNGINWLLENITSTVTIKKHIELDGSAIPVGTKGFLVHEYSNIKKLINPDYFSSLPIDEQATLTATRCFDLEEVILSFPNGFEIYEEILEEENIDKYIGMLKAAEKELLQILEQAPEEADTKKTPESETDSAPHVNLVSMGRLLTSDPQNTNAILAAEPFSAEQAKLYMAAGLRVCHVSLVMNQNDRVPFVPDMIKPGAEVYLIPTTKESMEADLERFKNDEFVIDPTEMSAAEVRAMKFLFYAIDNWKEVDLGTGHWAKDFLLSFQDTDSSLTIKDVQKLIEAVFTPETMAKIAVNRGYSIPELVEILYPRGTRLSPFNEQKKDMNSQISEPEAADTEEKTVLNPDTMKTLLQNHKQRLAKQMEHGKPSIIINAFAGAGAGKSTACMDICSGLKKAGYSAEYVQEYAKDLVYESSELLDGSPTHQFEILLEQMERQDRLVGVVDFVVTDSPILLNGIYNKEITPEYSQMLNHLHAQYEDAGCKNFSFFVKRDMNPSHFEENGRIHNFTESVKKDQEVKDMLSNHKIFYCSYDYSTIEKVVANAIRTRDKHLNAINKAENDKKPKEKQQPHRGQSRPKNHFYTSEESQEMVQYLKEKISIVDVISQWEPLKRNGNRYFKGLNHDSLIVDTRADMNCFYWNSQGESARGSVIDACQVFGNMDTSQALAYLYDMVGGQEAVYEYLYGNNPNSITYEPSTRFASIEASSPTPGEVQLPPRAKTQKNVYAYLGKTRMIHPSVTQEFFDRKMLYQEEKYNNCVFVGRDKEGKVNFGIKRGTNTYKRFVADCKGNDYSHGFYVDNGAKTLFVGESVIDIMSKMSILAEKGIDYHKYNYLALAGTQKQEPLINILSTYPENKEVVLGLDNDTGGRHATEQIKTALSKTGIPVYDDMPKKEGQDWNDLLKDYIKEKMGQPSTLPKTDLGNLPHSNKEKNPIKSASQMKQNILPTENPELEPA